MKKILKIAEISLLALIVAVLAVLHIVYHSFSPDDKGVTVESENLSYFYNSYDENRQAFLDEAQRLSSLYDDARIFKVNVPSEIDEELYIDFLHIPPATDSG